MYMLTACNPSNFCFIIRDFMDTQGPIPVNQNKEKKLSATQVVQKVMTTGNIHVTKFLLNV